MKIQQGTSSANLKHHMANKSKFKSDLI